MTKPQTRLVNHAARDGLYTGTAWRARMDAWLRHNDATSASYMEALIARTLRRMDAQWRRHAG